LVGVAAEVIGAGAVVVVGVAGVVAAGALELAAHPLKLTATAMAPKVVVTVSRRLLLLIPMGVSCRSPL